MNYTKHYQRLIERAQARTILPGEYVEVHHIVPKCLGGTNDSSNLVKLFPEEHYVAHQLLVKIYPNEPKIILAARMMTISSENIKRNNKEYKWLKERFVKSIQGVPRPDSTKRKISETVKASGRIPPSRKGAKMSSESRIKISKAMTKEKKSKPILEVCDRKHSEETKEKIRKNHVGMKGKNHSQETKDKISKSKSILSSYICPHCNLESKSGVMKRWHFEKCKSIIHS